MKKEISANDISEFSNAFANLQNQADVSNRNSVSLNRQSPIRISHLQFNDPQAVNKYTDNSVPDIKIEEARIQALKE